MSHMLSHLPSEFQFSKVVFLWTDLSELCCFSVGRPGVAARILHACDGPCQPQQCLQWLFLAHLSLPQPAPAICISKTTIPWNAWCAPERLPKCTFPLPPPLLPLPPVFKAQCHLPSRWWAAQPRNATHQPQSGHTWGTHWGRQQLGKCYISTLLIGYWLGIVIEHVLNKTLDIGH